MWASGSALSSDSSYVDEAKTSRVEGSI
jgi:hypothetical protein